MNISVIIPTLWRGDKLESMLELLNAVNRIEEIIIIDNNVSGKNIDVSRFSKVRYFEMNENIFVNPAWNLGAKIAKGDIITFLGDDLFFNPDFLENLEVPQKTIIGLSQKNFRPTEIGLPMGDWVTPEYNPKTVEALGGPYSDQRNVRPWAFGCILICQKNSFLEVPDDLKIWYGDDFLFYNFENKLVIEGLPVEYSKMSTSANLDVFEGVRNLDTKNWEKYK